MTFEQLGVAEPLVRAVTDMGFQAPMPVQERVIPHLLSRGGDVVALAQTGTGKTAAFGLPVLQQLDADKRVPQALILAPTRELCLQIAADLADFSRHLPAAAVLPVYGGSSIHSQIQALRNGVQVIVATPGRLIDLINRGVVDLSHIATVILDEADEMLNMGFLDSIEEILQSVPPERQMLMFSATMPRDIEKIARRYMHHPEVIEIGTRNVAADNIRHIYYMVQARDKYPALKRILDDAPGVYAIIFCRTRAETQEIADSLIRDGYNAEALHGDLSQPQRDLVMKKFHDRVISLLVATDVAARGIDVDDLTHVINYGLPDEAAIYTHRSGRTGRAGKRGTAIAIIHTRERGRLRDIERATGLIFERREVPTPAHIIEKQLYHLADRIERVAVDEQAIEAYMPAITRKLEWLSGADLLKRITAMELSRLIEYYKDAPTIEPVTDKKKETRRERPAAADKDRRTAEAGMSRIYINLGKGDGFYAANLIDMLNHLVPGKRVDVGRIDLMPGYSLFDIADADVGRVIGSLKGGEFFGKRVYVERAHPDKDYAAASRRRKKAPATEAEPEETVAEWFRRRHAAARQRPKARRRK